MDKDDINRVKDLLKKYGLEYKGRYFFSNTELNKIFNSLPDELKADEWTNVSDVIGETTYPSQKRAMVRQQSQLPASFQIVKYTLNDDKNKITEILIKNTFFAEYGQAVNKDRQDELLTDDDAYDANQGFVNFRPKSEFTEAMIELERVASSYGYSHDRIKIVNYERFPSIKTKEDMSQDMNFPKKMKVSIELERTTAPIRQPASHEIHHNGYVYKKLATEIDLSKANAIPPINAFDADERKQAAIPKSALQNHVSSSFPLHAYRGYIHFDDNTSMQVDITSFVPLRPTFYEVFGYAKVGSHTNELHVKVFQVIELDNANVKPADIFVKDDKKPEHKFWQFYRFTTEHMNKNKVPIRGRKSDTIIWMEVLKTLVHFSTFDPRNITHGIYAGFQDVGKTYIAEAYNAMRFPAPKMVMPGRMSIAGMFGGANQDLRLPDKVIKGHPVPGYIEHPSLFIEEVGNEIVNKNSPFQGILELFKGSLFAEHIDIPIVGGGTANRKAVIQMTMNYTNTYKSSIRHELMKIAEGIEGDVKSKKLDLAEFGESTPNLLSDIPTTKSSILREMVNKKDIFAAISTFQEDEYFDKEINMNISKIDALIFKKSIISFRELKEKNQLDINTSLPFPVLKRLPFSVFGGLNETIYERTEKEEKEEMAKRDATRSNISFLKNYRNLYIPNLRDCIAKNITEYAQKIGYYDDDDVVAVINRYAKKLYYFLVKKHPMFQKTGAETNEELVRMILLSLMMINEEDTPSLETCKIVEKWMILQCTSITTLEARSYLKMEQFISGIQAMTPEAYKKLNFKGDKKWKTN